MAPQKLKLLSLLVIALAGLFLTEHGITGLLAYDETVKLLCESDSECSQGACCKFSGESAGVCDLPENCKTISGISSGISGPFMLSTPEKSNLVWQTALGILVSIATFALFVYFLVFEPKKNSNLSQ